ncbi:hypothetical protein HY792_05700, partial [Candidatus Desantisbacteria bacterium]|nr:hypothetical protein [Candidatus Desantisbacteria bacterium]
ILFGTNNSIKTTNAQTNGSFETTFMVDTQRYGTATIIATGASSESALKRFMVSPNVFSVVPSSGTVGSWVTVSGTGYAASETITIGFGTTANIQQAATDIRGYFTTTFTVNTQRYGATAVKATGAMSSSAISTFFIQKNIYYVSPLSGTVGRQVEIRGTGYGSIDNIRIDFGSTLTISTGVANTTGWFKTFFTVDTQVFGSTTIMATGVAGDNAQAVFSVMANMDSVRPTTGSVGTVITIEGTGYTGSSDITIDFGDVDDIIATQTDAKGYFVTIFTVDTQSYGTKTVAAQDTADNRVERTFLIIPSVYLVTPTIGTVGQTITVKGAGFVRYDTLTIDLGDRQGIAGVVTDPRGVFETSFVVDTQIVGKKMIVVNGTMSTKATSSFTITGGITISPSIGTIGRVVEVKGSGFGSEDVIGVSFGTTGHVATEVSSICGTFSTTFAMDGQVYGTTTISATGKSYAEAYIFVKPNFHLVIPTTGTVGTVVRIAGTGYAASELVAIGFGNTLVINTTMSSGNGYFETIFTVDTQKYGSTYIKATGASSSGVALNTFFVTPDLYLVSPVRGTIGSVVEIRGTGYDAIDTVNVRFGNTPTIATGVAGGNGAFSVTFGVNTQPYGTTTIIATGVRSASAGNAFTIMPSIYSILPKAGTVGTVVEVKGIGYGTNDDIIIGFGASGALAEGDADANGIFTIYFTTNTQPYGTTTVIVTGVYSASCETAFFIYPNLYSVSPNAGTIGRMIEVKGSGYASGEAITVRFGTNMAIQNIAADSRGYVEIVFNVDTQVYGTTTVKLTGLIAGSATNTFRIMPNIYTVTPTKGTVGTQVEVMGAGYAATETIRIDFGNTNNIKMAAADNLGRVSTSFTVNVQPYGQKIVRLTGSSSTSVENTFTIIPAIYSVTPVLGSVGTIVEINGSGYSAADSIRIDFGSNGRIQTAVADSSGYFTASFTVDTQKYGTTTINAIGASSASAINTFVIVGGVMVTPTSGTVGTKVYTEGSGFGANEHVGVNFGTTPTIVTMNTDSRGVFTGYFTVDTQSYGQVVVEAVNSTTAQTGFFIMPALYRVTPSTGTVGTVVTLKGNGYDDTEVITIRFGAALLYANSDGVGYFEARFTVDTQGYGTCTIRATGVSSGEANNVFFIKPMIYSVSPITGSVGTVVEIIGVGYNKIDPVTIDFGTTSSIKQTTTNISGYFKTTFTVDTQSLGTTTVKATGSLSESAFAGFGIRPSLYLVSPTTGTVGMTAEVYGQGYAQGEGITIDFGNYKAIQTTITDEKGYFAASFEVDTQVYGKTTIVARGMMNAENTFFIKQNIASCLPNKGSVGTIVSICGTGYSATNSITIMFGTNINIVQITSDEKGYFEALFTVDTQGYGTTTITASGAKSTFFIMPDVYLVSPTNGTVGSIVEIRGTGYKQNDNVNICLGTTPNIQVKSADVKGWFKTTFTVDTQVYGSTTIRAMGIDAAENSFFVKPAVYSVKPTSGSVGTVVTIKGTGYMSLDTLTVMFGNNSNIKMDAAQANGSFETTFVVDTQAVGTTTITVKGTFGQASNVFNIVAAINISPTIGTVGTTVTINGVGFKANSLVRVNFGNTTTITTIMSDLTGAFSGTFVVNTQSFGQKIVSASAKGYAEQAFSIIPELYLVSPSRGSVGTIVEIRGTGYDVQDDISIAFGTTLGITDTVADDSGWFSTTFTVNTQSFGTTTVTASGAGVASNRFVILPQVYSVAPTAGTVGTIVTISGTGYGASDSIKVSFGTNASIQTAVASAIGTFSTTFTVDTQRFGICTITASGVSVATNVFFILPQVVSVLPATGTVGTIVTISGTGYSANNNITVSFGTNTNIRQTTASVYGSFTCMFTVDTQAYGTTTIAAAGIATASNRFYILPEVYSVIPTSGTVGTVVTVLGTGYGRNDNITVAFGTNTNIQTATADICGWFSTTWTVDTQVYGTTTIAAAGIATAYNRFVILPEVYSVTPTSGTVGTVVTVLGTGYGAGDSITVSFGTNANIQTAAAGTNGSFTAAFTVDTQVYGTTTIAVTGVATAYNRFYILPEIYSVTPTLGTVGTNVTIQGTGYSANDSITVRFGTNVNIQTATANYRGWFSTTFTVDTQGYGTTTIAAAGIATAYNRFFICPEVYSVSPTLGSVGTVVTVRGTGYAANDNITVRFGINTNIQQAVAGIYGSFGTTFTVDTQSYGTTTIAVAGIATAYNRFVILPQVVSVIPTAGTVGTIVTISGTGYGAGDNITVSFGRNPTIQTAAAGTNGSFTAAFTVDTQAYGTTTLTAAGIATASNRFVILPEVYSVLPTAGTVGTVVTISGTGYATGDNITVNFGTKTNIQTATADIRGWLSTTFTVDTQSYGTTTITA